MYSNLLAYTYHLHLRLTLLKILKLHSFPLVASIFLTWNVSFLKSQEIIGGDILYLLACGFLREGNSGKSADILKTLKYIIDH